MSFVSGLSSLYADLFLRRHHFYQDPFVSNSKKTAAAWLEKRVSGYRDFPEGTVTVVVHIPLMVAEERLLAIKASSIIHSSPLTQNYRSLSVYITSL